MNPQHTRHLVCNGKHSSTCGKPDHHRMRNKTDVAAHTAEAHEQLDRPRDKGEKQDLRNEFRRTGLGQLTHRGKYNQ